MVSGCNSTKTVYPNECTVSSKIEIQDPDPDWMRDPKTPYKPTEEQLKNGASNTEALKLIASKNNGLWQEDRDNLKALQGYTKKLLEELRKQK